MAQEPDRYLLPVLQATASRFGPLTRVRKFVNFQKILPPQPLGAKVPNLIHWWGWAYPQGKKFWGPRSPFGGVMGVKVSSS